ncbi:M50 family metallopeptidase [Nocardioides insulae]|uniref:M50 family metallopeptidase n=1 Tax=Nocardioides insulae TaxID=394734 RepID=UPI0003F643DD|nr:site-2 protease family protein [Nocardioides insulae]
MTALLYALGVLVFVVALLASIGLHELGHMIPAKKFGAKVSRYFIGFGPTLWSRTKGETEYGVKAIPLGGYVKIVGMLPPVPDQVAEFDAEGNPRPQRVRDFNTGMFTSLIADARQAEWDLVEPEDEDRLFYKLPWWKKAIVMAGGPTVNLVIAFFAFLTIFSTYGVHSLEPAEGPPVVETVSECVIPYAESGRECTASDPPSPAYEAGLEPGDTIVSFNGTEITDWDQLRGLIQDNAAGTAVIGYERDGELETGTTSTTVEARPTDAEGETIQQVGFLGITPTTVEVVEKGGPIFTLQQMWEMTKDSVVAILQLPVKVWDVAQAIVGVEDRAADSPMSIVGGGRIAGEVASHDEVDTTQKLVLLGSLIGGFNLFIGLFNFVPLLPLDGGHIASALWEGLRRWLARLTGRPDPGHVDPAKLLPVAYVVGLAIVAMGLVLVVADFVVPLHLTSS